MFDISSQWKLKLSRERRNKIAKSSWQWKFPLIKLDELLIKDLKLLNED